MELTERSLSALNKAKNNLSQIEDGADNYVGGRGGGGIVNVSSPNPNQSVGKPNKSNMGETQRGGGRPDGTGGGKPENVGGGRPEGKGKPELTGLALASEKSGKDLLSKLTDVKELGKALKPIPSNVPMEVDIELAKKGIMRGRGAAKFIRRKIRLSDLPTQVANEFLGALFGGNKEDVSSMSFEDAMNSYDSGVKSGTLKSDGTKRSFLDQIGGVQGAVTLASTLFGGLSGRGTQPQQPQYRGPEKKDNTLMYVGIGGAVLIVIIIAFVMLKKK
jgi:hypothetical protein